MKGLWFAVLLLTAPAGGLSAAVTAQGADDRLIVMYQEGVGASEQRLIAEAQGLKVVDEIPELRMLLVQAGAGAARPAKVRLLSHPRVMRVEPDIWRNWIEEAPASFAQRPLPSLDSVMERLPKLRNIGAGEGRTASEEIPWGVRRHNAPAAWSTNQGSGVKVAVIDTGIDPTHPDLAGRVAGGVNTVEKDQPWADDHFHGTHVAGTIAAAMDDAKVVGIAPKATLYAVKVLTKEGSGNLFSIMQGVMWTAQNGIQVANMSLGAPQEIPLLQYALQMARNAGVTIVAAAGNDGKAVNWPAAYPETIAVSALCPPGVTNTKLCPTTQEGISTFSSRGPEVDFIAAGVLVPSTVPLSHDASGVKAYSGTSMACPHVAGLAALAVAKGAQGADAVAAALKAAAQPLFGLTPSEQGSGVINAAMLR